MGAPKRDFRSPAAPSAVSAPRVEDSRINDLRRQMDGINSKLDRLIESVALLAKPKFSEPVAKEEKPAAVKSPAKPPKNSGKAPAKKQAKKEAKKKKK